MLSFYFLNERYIFNPQLAVDFLGHIWATEPLGMLSVSIMLTSLLVTLSFKMFDLWNDARKERARKGRLRIELFAKTDAQGRPGLCAIIANAGQEPVVIRDIGYARKRLRPFPGAEFVPVAPLHSPLPHALNARDILQIEIPAIPAAGTHSVSSAVTALSEPSAAFKHLQTIAATFQVRDSLGKRWPASETQSRLARRQLSRIQTNHLGQPSSRPTEAVTP